MEEQIKKRKRGRPKLPKEISRTRSMHIRVSAEEIKAMTAKAKKEGLTISLWLRKLIRDSIKE